MAKYMGGNYGVNGYGYNNSYNPGYQYPYYAGYQQPQNPNMNQQQGIPTQGQQPFNNQYNTQFNTNYQQQNQQYQQPAPTSPTFVAYVNGVEGAKAYIMPPNSCGMLIDCDNPMAYIKTSNSQCQASIRYLKLMEVPEVGTPTSQSQPKGTVTREEFDYVKDEVTKLKQYLNPEPKYRKEGDVADDAL